MSKKKTVAVLGASKNSDKYGNKSVRAHLRAGFDVFPVNPHEKEIEGLKVYASLLDIPVGLDRITVYLPPQVGITLLDDIAQKAPKELFLNPGSEDEALIEKSKSLGLFPILACSIVDIGQNPAI